MERLLEKYEKARNREIGVPDDNRLIPLGDILNQAILRPSRPQLGAATRLLKPLSRVRAGCLGHHPKTTRSVSSIRSSDKLPCPIARRTPMPLSGKAAMAMFRARYRQVAGPTQ